MNKRRGLRRRLKYGPEAAGAMPRERPQRESNELADGLCPRCSYDFLTRRQYCWAICPRCGYLLKIEPFWGVVSIDDVSEVALPATAIGQKVFKRKYREGVQKILENWRQRGLVNIEKETDPVTGKIRFRLKRRTHAEVVVDEIAADDYGARELSEEEAQEDPTDLGDLGPSTN